MIGQQTTQQYLLRVLEALASNGLGSQIYQKYLYLKTINPPRAKATNFVIQLFQLLGQSIQHNQDQMWVSLRKLVAAQFNPDRVQALLLPIKRLANYVSQLRQSLSSCQRKIKEHELRLEEMAQERDLLLKGAEEQDRQQEQLLARISGLQQKVQSTILECTGSLSSKQAQISSLHSLYQDKLRQLNCQVERSSKSELNQEVVKEIELLQRDLSSQTKLITELYEAYVRPVSQLVEEYREYSPLVQGKNVQFIKNLLKKYEEHNQLLRLKSGLE